MKPPLTFIVHGFLIPEEGQRWEGLDAVGLRELLVSDLDELHAESVRVIVYGFKFSQDLIAVLAALLVYGKGEREEGN